jgi:hypothetical protein
MKNLLSCRPLRERERQSRRKGAVSQPENVGTKRGSAALRVGDLVEVRSASEILATLDKKSELENLPFMPEMLPFCGKRLTVHKVAHKLCDTISASGMRRMENAVHLTGARCDGQAHGGCQTGCSFYWKEAWLKRVTPEEPAVGSGSEQRSAEVPDLRDLEMATRKADGPDGEVRYACQATELLRAAPIRLRFFDLRQYVTDVRCGNAGLLATLRTLLVGLFNAFQGRSTRMLPHYLRIKGGLHWGFVKGTAGNRTPTLQVALQPGELVRVRAKQDIMRTLDANRLNRGMGFEEEMARYCGHTARVTNRVERCIDERTGRMLTMKNPCIVLDNVVCAGAYHSNCPREFLPFWREIWLERVNGSMEQGATSKGGCHSQREGSDSQEKTA